MAAEIRDLEDQLYEYDHEYRALEQELESLRRSNQQMNSQSVPQALPRASSPLEFQPRYSEGASGGAVNTPESVMPKSILSAPESLPTPSSESASGTAPRVAPQPPAVSPSDTDIEFDAGELLPPTIEQGESIPPPLPVVQSNQGSDRSAAPENDFELNLSRIEIPAMLAGQSSAGAKVTVAQEQVTDTRVIELAFHPSLCRSVNFDQQEDDDGLYLVLIPRNERGQMVPSYAKLSIVVLDPAREGESARIGRWDYSPSEVQSKMQPIGTQQGIHLSLPWNGPDPSADRVIVFARYTYENGRQVIGQKEIFVNSEHGLKTVWTPRGSGVTTPASTRFPVAQASATEPVSPKSGNHAVVSASSTETPVVRPPEPYQTAEAPPPPANGTTETKIWNW